MILEIGCITLSAASNLATCIEILHHGAPRRVPAEIWATHAVQLHIKQGHIAISRMISLLHVSTKCKVI